MKLKELKEYLHNNEIVKISSVPEHFHITEVGLVTKDFVDCGGQQHSDMHVYLQIWVADDKEHRLESKKLLQIINNRSTDNAGIDFDIREVLFEYDGDSPSIGTYTASIFEEEIGLIPIKADCLAKDICLPNQCGPGCC